MIVTITDQFGGEVEVDTDRYDTDVEYRNRIHEEMDIAEWERPLNWRHLCATEEELEAQGQKAAFDSRDYPTEEAASAALKQFIHDIFEEALRNAAARRKVHA